MQWINRKNIPFGYMAVHFPEEAPRAREAWDALVEQELLAIREKNAGYDRKAFQSGNAYSRYFKKFKKTYMVMLQLESVLFKGRGIPPAGPLVECMFLSELKTMVLSGVHDLGRIDGPLVVDLAQGGELYPGMHDKELHLAKDELCLRDETGIISGILSGPDAQTCVGTDTREAVYFAFGVEGVDGGVLLEQLRLIRAYLKTACPFAVAEEPVII